MGECGIPVRFGVLQVVREGVETEGHLRDLGPAQPGEAQGVEFHGVDNPIALAHLHMHGKARNLAVSVRFFQEVEHDLALFPHDLRTADVEPVGGVFGIREVVAQDVEQVRLAFLVEIRIERVFGSLDERLHDEAPASDDALVVPLRPSVAACGDVGDGLRPVIFGADDVDAQAEEAHARLEHEGGMLGREGHARQLFRIDRLEEVSGVHGGEQRAHLLFVLEDGKPMEDVLPVHVPGHPSEMAFRHGVEGLARIDALDRLRFGDDVDAYPLLSQPQGHGAFQDGLPAQFQVAAHAVRYVGVVEDDHGAFFRALFH